MELRGLGVINVKNCSASRRRDPSKRIELVVQLERWDPSREYERLGLDDVFDEILGLRVPLIRMPVAPGRNIAILVEVAARNQLLRSRGHTRRARSRSGSRSAAARDGPVAGRRRGRRARAWRRPVKKARGSTPSPRARHAKGPRGVSRARAGAPRRARPARSSPAKAGAASAPRSLHRADRAPGSGKVAGDSRASRTSATSASTTSRLTLIPTLGEAVAAGGSDIEKVAIVVDVREGEFLSSFPKIFNAAAGDAAAQSGAHLSRGEPRDARCGRFSDTRRPHPLGRNARSPKGFATSARA
jgi:hypothetical protein